MSETLEQVLEKQNETALLDQKANCTDEKQIIYPSKSKTKMKERRNKEKTVEKDFGISFPPSHLVF